MNALGFDPSLTCSGFAYTLHDEVRTGTIKTNSLRGPERLDFIRKALSDILDHSTLKHASRSLVVLEGYAMGIPGGGGRAFDIGELGGVLKHYVWSRGIDLLLVPPSNLKMFATCKGNATKPQVMEAIADYWGYSVKQNDEADAFVLMKMGEAFLNKRSLKTYDEKRRSAISKCQLFTGLHCS